MIKIRFIAILSIVFARFDLFDQLSGADPRSMETVAPGEQDACVQSASQFQVSLNCERPCFHYHVTINQSVSTGPLLNLVSWVPEREGKFFITRIESSNANLFQNV